MGQQMKVRMIMMRVLLIALAMLLSGTAFAEETFVRIGTSTVGGGFYLIGNTIAQLGTQKLKEINFTAVTGGSIKNCINLGTKEIELGMVQSSTVNEAWNGINSFKTPIKSLRYVTAIYFMPAHILVNKDAGIQSVADFKGKRVDFGSVGQGIEINTREILSVHDLSEADVRVERFGRNEVEEALKVGDSQAHIWTTNAPNAKISEMIRSEKVGLIGLEEEKIKEITEKFPHYAPAVIPGGLYPGYDKDIPVVAAVGSLLTYEDMPEDTIYKITKMLHENNKFLSDRLNYFNGFNLDMALAGMSVPLHPGAKKYYVEKGLIKE
ncbi:TAXI family TRAP transporter solute-binding subunit [Fretibacterium sp. OH1220_COT-178]|uniref:TAXI family TRAP transporter solute-binding subunit n=1 Tax=Fretibacterium sp. OH1220_COT-178 TaxID=2491047 RepID=UPI00131520AC|nr:TAXI family TRAP transporter solute-binding subunit [Fretibacterium sp. OH1220_COT-178]